jgi:hypothetical protein
MHPNAPQNIDSRYFVRKISGINILQKPTPYNPCVWRILARKIKIKQRSFRRTKQADAENQNLQ